MSRVGVEHDQSGPSARMIGSIDSRKRSPDRVADEEEFGARCELLEDRFEVFGNLDDVVVEWSDVRGVRVQSESIELSISIVSEDTESARTLESALAPSTSLKRKLRTSKEDRHSLMTACHVI